MASRAPLIKRPDEPRVGDGTSLCRQRPVAWHRHTRVHLRLRPVPGDSRAGRPRHSSGPACCGRSAVRGDQGVRRLHWIRIPAHPSARMPPIRRTGRLLAPSRADRRLTKPPSPDSPTVFLGFDKSGYRNQSRERRHGDIDALTTAKLGLSELRPTAFPLPASVGFEPRSARRSPARVGF